MTTDLLLVPLADAFLQVGVYVAAMLALFGWVQHRWGAAMTRFLADRWRTAPAVGALLGVVPGCGGAIVVMPLYLRGTVSFGTVVAALVATMGDASFVLLATDLRLGLGVHGALLVAGLVSGYAVDALGIAPARPVAAGASVGAAEAYPPVRRAGAAPAPTHLGGLPTAFWVLASGGLLLALPLSMRLTTGAALAPAFGGVDPALALGAVGTLVAVVVHRTRPRAAAGACAHATGCPHLPADGRGVLLAAARETCFVITWVAAAFVATAVAIEVLGLDPTALATAGGVVGVLAGTAIGLIPGCAPQVLLTGLHASGLVPLPTLLANAASQDGDALFPLIAMDRRAALTATAATTVPGVVLGLGWLLAS